MSIYSPDGSLQVTVMNGSTYTGLYAPDGSMNVVAGDTEHLGIMHPSGAMRVTVVGGSAGGGGEPTPDPLTVFDYFADNGSTFPWYGDTSEGHLYVEETNTTWFSYEVSYSNKRYVQVKTYNHTTNTWAGPYFAGLNNDLVDDDHGASIDLTRDDEGYVYCSYGSHANANDQKQSRTTNPDDPSAWTELSAFTGFFTYPTRHCFGTDQYMFLRGGPTGSGASEQDKYTFFKATGVTGGAPSFGAPVTIFELGDLPSQSSRFYNGNHVVVGTDIYIPFTQADNPNSYSRDVFLFIYNTTDGSVRNLDGSVTIPEVNFPINITTARASFRLVNQTGAGTYGTRVSIARTPNGHIHFGYGEGPAIAGPYTMKHRVWNGSTLSDAFDVGAYPLAGDEGHQTDRHTLVGQFDNSVDVYWVTADQFSHTWGGDYSRRRRLVDGTWGDAVIVARATEEYPLNCITAVKNGSLAAQVVFAETVVEVDWAAAESNRLKMYAYSPASGFLTQFKPESERGFQPLDYFEDNVIGWWDLQSKGRWLDLATTATQWQDRARGQLLSQTTAAMKPVYSATGWDGTLPTITGDGLGPANTGDVLAGTGPFAPVQSIFIVSERASQNTGTGTTLRPLYKTAVSNGGKVGYLTTVRPSVDAGQSNYMVQGSGTGNSTVTISGAFGIGTKAVLYGLIQDTGTTAGVNGTLGTTGALGITTAAHTSLFGDSSLTTDTRYAGKISEVLIIDRVLTTAERQAVEGYLAWKWGIQASLPVDHPYRNTRPPVM